MEKIKEKKKVLIFYGTLGGGHKVAAFSLKEELEKHGYEVYMEDFIEFFNPKFNNFFRKAYMKFSRKEARIINSAYEIADKLGDEIVMKNLYRVNSHKLAKHINKINPDYIFSTFPIGIYYLGRLKSEEKINKNISISVIITDFDVFSFYYDKEEYINNFFVASNEVKEDLKFRGINEKKIYVTGIPIKCSFRKSYDRTYLLNMFKETGYKGNLPLAVFFGGGSLGLKSKKTKYIFEKFVEGLKNYFFIFITGKNEKMYKEYIDLVKEKNLKNVYIMQFTENVAELMSLSDMIISKPGGLTTSETLASGKAFFMENPIMGQEVANAKYVEKYEAGVHIHEKNIDEIIKRIKSEKDLIERLSFNAKKISKPNASEDIIKIISCKEKVLD